jgi:hypothetical protein
MEHYKRVLALINNRMYGDYYKLFVIICAQCKEANLTISPPDSNIIVYKDLDPLFDYKINDITLLFDSIVGILEELQVMHNNNNETILSHNLNNSVGFSIAGFLSTLKYENIILNEQIALYLNYMAFYQSSQKGYLNKALLDVVRFSNEIDDKILVNYRIEHDVYKQTIDPEPVEEVGLIREPEPEPVREPEVESIKEPEPIKELEPEPIKELESEPVKELEPEPIKELEPEPIKELEPEPIKELESEPVKELEPEPVKEPEPEPIKEPEPEPITPLRIENAQSASSSSLITAPEGGVLNERRCKEAESEPIKEPESEPIKEPIKEPEPEPIKEPKPEPIKVTEPVKVKTNGKANRSHR